MTELLLNHSGGHWVAGKCGRTGRGTPLFDPVLGHELVRVDAAGLDLPSGFDFARQHGGAARRALNCWQRADRLAAVAQVLLPHRDAYDEIATANSGTVKSDSAVDIDGAIYTLSAYAKLGAAMGDGRWPSDGAASSLAKGAASQSQHVQLPVHGLAPFINAFNFPA